MITPMEIHNKEFKRKIRGYNQDEVDEFLDKIVIDYEKLYRENAELKDKLNFQNEKMDHYINIENTLQNTLLMAQKSSEDIEKNAKEKAAIIIKEAQRQAENIIRDSNYEIVNIIKDKEELMKELNVFKTKMETILKSQLAILDDINVTEDLQNKTDYQEYSTSSIDENKVIESQLEQEDNNLESETEEEIEINLEFKEEEDSNLVINVEED